MILFDGVIYQDNLQEELIKKLHSRMNNTLANSSPLTIDQVINACDKLYQRVLNHDFDDIILPLLKMMDLSYEYFLNMAQMFSKNGLEEKCRIELGDDFRTLKPLQNGCQRKRMPLGILFHIAAGNVDALPAYSVIEGLLAGNINILKLPSGDSGLSITLLNELIKVEQSLSQYIYVFDVPSTEVETLKKLASYADGIIVWGGDAACKAARELADIKTKIIPWGHKLSFAYCSNYNDQQLHQLARHIIATNQVLCSSCQGIYLNTNSIDEIQVFGKHFFDILAEENALLGKADIGMRGKNTLQLYCDQLEKDYPNTVYNKDGVSVVIKPDSELELSNLFRNVWIKRLPEENIVETLKKHKSHLQTCGLLCNQDEKEKLSTLLARAGVVRITTGDMSRMVLGEAHDGTYPLLQYTRIVEIDK